MLGPIHFKIFIYQLFYRKKNSELHNFAGDDTVSAVQFSTEKLLETLERECQIATDWFKKAKCL